MKLTEAEKQVLIATGVIRGDGKPAHNKNYKLFNDFYFRDDLVDWRTAFTTLSEKELLVSTHGSYYLTKKGCDLSESLLRNNSFSYTLLQCEKSKTYKVFCERVYGKSLTQFNMTDMEQLQKLLEVLNLGHQNKVLELGCGIGTITEYISDVTKADILGIDFATNAIKRAMERTSEKRQRLHFQEGNMNDLDFPDDWFDTIIAIDTRYFVEDLEKTIGQMKEILKPDGHMGLFFSSMTPSQEAKEILQPDKTRLAKALQKHDLSFQTWDFTENEKEIWFKEPEVAEDLKNDFEEEGNLNIYNHRISESEQILPYVKTDRCSRFLYHVTP